MLAITLKQRGVEIPRNKGKKIKGKRTRNASLSSCSSWSWSVGAVSLAPMLLTISTNSSKLTFPSPKMTKTKRTHHVHQHRLILFLENFFFGVSQQYGYHLFSNAVLLESLHFSFFCYNYLLPLFKRKKWGFTAYTLFILSRYNFSPVQKKDFITPALYSPNSDSVYFKTTTRKETLVPRMKRTLQSMRRHKPRHRGINKLGDSDVSSTFLYESCFPRFSHSHPENRVFHYLHLFLSPLPRSPILSRSCNRV